MAKISQRTANKRGIQRNIKSSVETHAEALNERLEKKLFPGGPPEDLTIGDVTMAICDLLAVTYARFQKADHVVATETAQDRRHRVRRDKAVTDLRASIINTRSVVGGVWGDAGRQHVGLSGQTPETPDALLTYAENAWEQLTAGLDDFETVLKVDPPDISQYADHMKAKIDELDEAVETLQINIRGTQDARSEREEVAQDWGNDYVPVATIVEHLFRLADMPEHAERVRPTSRRRSGLAEDEDLEHIENDPDIEVVDELDVDDTAPVNEDVVMT